METAVDWKGVFKLLMSEMAYVLRRQTEPDL